MRSFGIGALHVVLKAVALICLLNIEVSVLGQELESDSSDSIEAAEVKDADVEGDSSNATATAIPEWFSTENEFDSTTRMAFIKTPDSFLTKAEAEICLASEARKLAKSVIEQKLEIADAESLGLEGDRILNDFLFRERMEFVEDLECKRESEKMGDDLSFFLGYAQLHFDESFDEYVRQKIAQCRTQKRLIKSGLVGGSVLGLLAVAFGYFKMENATRGFYSRRLQTGSLVLALALIFLVYLISLQLI